MCFHVEKYTFNCDFQEDPYVIPKVKDPKTLDDYEGYIPDLLERISRIINRKFTLQKVTDGKYGAKDTSTGQWNGMMGEVISEVCETSVS